MSSEVPADVIADLTSSGDEPIDAEVPAIDADWSEQDWKGFIDRLTADGIVSYHEVGVAILSSINPPQVGTSIASKKTFQAHFEPRKVWQAVRAWFYAQAGRCIDCGTRLDMQADHIETRQEHGDKADTLDNMTLRCRRHNVARRPSHKKGGGKTFLTAEAALMWLLLVKRPETYQAFEELCRQYGLTMANIRFQEAWAMARWLQKEEKYLIAPESTL